MQKVCSVVIALNETVENFCEGNTQRMRNSYKSAFQKEREADELKRKILTEIYGRIIHPLDQEHIVRLILTADDIASNAKAAAMKISHFVNPKSVPAGLRKTMKDFSENLVGIAMKTYDAIRLIGKNKKAAITAANEVEKTEELIDDFRAKEVYPKLLEWFEKTNNIGLSLLIKEIIDNMENLADRCEDVGDIIRFIALSL
jgi:predicted phosphate transport protein (TIGR00153 family)